MINKAIDLITEQDIHSLKENEISEGKTLDYKLKISLDTKEEKREFLADVVSFANTIGGDLIIGISEKNGVAEDICGFSCDDIDEFKQKMDNLIRDAISPRLSAISIKDIKLKNDKYIIVIRINKSWNSPHMVDSNNKFYGRNSSGKYPLDITEIRHAFINSGNDLKKYNEFLCDKIANIVGGFVNNLPLCSIPYFTIHMIPLNIFDGTAYFSVEEMQNILNNFNMIHFGINKRINYDGILFFDANSDGDKVESYTQFYRNGTIESVFRMRADDYKLISFSVAEYGLGILKDFLKYMENLNLSLPILVYTSLINAKGCHLVPHSIRYKPQAIDREIIISPEIVIDNYDVDLESVMKPAFDVIYNSTGLLKAYDLKTEL